MRNALFGVNRRRRFTLATLPLMALVLGALVGCAGAVEPSVTDKASAEATAILQSAQATALVKNAQGTATALLKGPDVSQPTPSAVVHVAGAVATAGPATPGVDRDSDLPGRLTAVPGPGNALAGTPPGPVATETPDSPEVGVLSVGYAADGAYIVVNFRAPPRVARNWMQGAVYVVDEATGTKYDGIPVAPILGPLFSRPNRSGQPGYVMFENRPPIVPRALPPGSLVTVVLGDFKQEHVRVSNQ